MTSGDRAAERARDSAERVRELAARRAVLGTQAGKASTADNVEAAMASLGEAQDHALRARERLRESFGNAAAAHDRAAEVRARAAERGGSGAEEHRAAAAQHRAAAEADRKRAAET